MMYYLPCSPAAFTVSTIPAASVERSSQFFKFSRDLSYFGDIRNYIVSGVLLLRSKLADRVAKIIITHGIVLWLFSFCF